MRPVSTTRPRRRGIVGIAARLCLVGLALLLATALAVTLDALRLERRAAPPAPAAAIIVLGGGADPDGTPASDTVARARHGIALFRDGLAPRLHFTGGGTDAGAPDMGAAMAALARAEGVPEAAITTENASRSTLQNALLSRAVLPPDAASPAVLVSDGYHLARARASFRWAGYGPIHVSAATAFGGGTVTDRMQRIGRETLAIWFNGARVIVWSGLDALGFDRARSIDLLAWVAAGRAAAAGPAAA